MERNSIAIHKYQFHLSNHWLLRRTSASALCACRFRVCRVYNSNLSHNIKTKNISCFAIYKFHKIYVCRCRCMFVATLTRNPWIGRCAFALHPIRVRTSSVWLKPWFDHPILYLDSWRAIDCQREADRSLQLCANRLQQYEIILFYWKKSKKMKTTASALKKNGEENKSKEEN